MNQETFATRLDSKSGLLTFQVFLADALVCSVKDAEGMRLVPGE